MSGRHAALAVAGTVLPALAAASELELPIAELASPPLAVAVAPAAPRPASPPAAPLARLVWLDPAHHACR
jgi:hypothetical protein